MTDSSDAVAGYNGRTEAQAGQQRPAGRSAGGETAASRQKNSSQRAGKQQPADRETAVRLDEAVR